MLVNIKISKNEKVAYQSRRCYTSYASCSFKPGPVIGLRSDFWNSSTITKYKQKVWSMIKHNKYVIVFAAQLYIVYDFSYIA